MSPAALIVTYHAVETGPRPLCIEPDLFAAQLDWFLAAGYRPVTFGALASAVRDRALTGRELAITFDDGFASVVREAVPRLVERGMPATIFCVAGHLGGSNDWPTQPADAPRFPLAGAVELREAAGAGIELGSHGVEHAPLHAASPALASRELRASRELLEQELSVPVASFAFPYSAAPGPAARAVLEQVYEAACTGGPALASIDADPLALPRVDAHYLRRVGLLRAGGARALAPYVALRAIGARARRLVRQDYAAERGRRRRIPIH